MLHPVSGPGVNNVPSSSASTISSTSSSSKKPVKHLADLEKEFQSENIRSNEGEAANYGIFFDDTKYDYMQHLRELGGGGGNSHFIEAAPAKGKGKNKGMKLEDALREVSLDDDSRSEFDGGAASVYGGSVYGGSQYSSVYGGRSMRSTASSVRKPTYQDMQDIPDAIAGFQPNMDPRLREVLEALDDEAYVDDNEDDDVFGELTKDGEEMDQEAWEDTLFEDEEEDDGWESDATEKAPVQRDTTEFAETAKLKDTQDKDAHQQQQETPSSSQEEEDDDKINTLTEFPTPDEPVPDAKPEDGDWMREFAKFKKDAKKASKAAPVAPSESDRRTAASTLFTVGGTPIRRKKRKGALTNPSAYSMTSSSLARTEGLRLLDDRFEKIEALYALDEEGEEEYEDGMSMVSGMTGMSRMTGMTGMTGMSSASKADGDVPLRHDFDEVMDSFLAGWTDRSSQAKRKGAKGKRGKNGNEAIGMKMLDEVRQGLGPARVPGKVQGRA